MILDCPGRRAGMFFDIMNHVLPEGDQLQSAFGEFEKKCRLYKALSDEDASENLKVAARAQRLAGCCALDCCH